MTRHLLVGSGAAALAAAEEIRAADSNASITLVSEESHGFYSRPGLAYLLTGAVPERQLQIRTPAEVSALRLERIADRATLIRPEAHRLRLASGRELPYDRLLVATGARSIPLDVPGGSLAGVYLLDGLDEAVRLARAARRRRRAVVIGGGSTALEIVEGLHTRGVETHYFLRGDRYWSRTLDQQESSLVEARLQAAGVILHRRTEVVRVLEQGGRVAAVETRAGALIPCDLLCVATGVRPRLDLARASGLAIDRGVLVDQFLETSVPDIYAAGDVAQISEGPGAPAVLETLWASACGEGRVAGRNMSGQPMAYRRPVALNVTSLAGLVTTVMGDVGGREDPDLVTITRGQSERWSLGRGSLSITDAAGQGRIRICLSEREITGAVVIGDQTLVAPLLHLIGERADITPIRAEVLQHPDRLVSTVIRLSAELEGRAA
jgi:3-phenylpropionate/trans-cinnamate dioxygenase ferredoxin reductase component